MQYYIQMKDYRIRSQILILLTILFFQHALVLDVNIQLPPLKQYNYSLKQSEPVNVTVGENFAIGISQFDIQKVPADLKVYQISQEKFINMFETMEKHKKKNISVLDRNQVDANIFSCRIKNPSMQITKTINVFNQRPTSKFSFSSQENIIYVPIRRHQLLYVLDTTLLQIQVYHYTPQKLNFLSSAQLGISANNQKIAMGSSSSEELVYIFSSMGIWSIQTKTVLTNVQFLQRGLGNFDSKNFQVDKLYQGPYNFLLGLRRLSQIYIIPQKSELNSTFLILRKFKQNNITPQDIAIYQGFLYVLDLHHGIFVYKILGDGSVSEYDYISWKSYGNIQITVHQNSVFIRYLDQQGQKIVELNYNPQTHTADLVRYIKSDQAITSMLVQKVPVSLSQHLYYISELFLFLTSDNGQVQIYPYNVDPRKIKSAHNGVKIHIENVVKVLHLFEDIYLVITYEKLIYAKIRIEKPELQCQMKQSTGHIYYEIQFSSNVSTCESFEPTFEHKSFFSTSCQLISNYIIYVDDPDLSRFQKALLYGCVFIVVASFIVGLLCLIQWRNNKLSLIGRIKDEIVKLRDRYRKMQPFTEEQPETNKNQIQFELPEAPPLPDN